MCVADVELPGKLEYGPDRTAIETRRTEPGKPRSASVFSVIP
jgi:hypothetical protein